MPLVFFTDAPTLWESSYADILGVQYEFPGRYRSLVSPGDRFLYYRGSRGREVGGVGYFGEGIIGKIRPSARPDHLIALVHDVELFGDAVPIKDERGNYFETGTTSGTNWANGVRRVSSTAYDGILRAAEKLPGTSRVSPGFASPEHASVMERYSVRVVLHLLWEEFGTDSVHEMPVNNPGYDISVLLPTDELHVEVKGTVLQVPTFHLSEGQRGHAELRGELWRLYVVYGIDTSRDRHHVARCSGADLARRGNLKPEAWSGLLGAQRD